MIARDITDARDQLSAATAFISKDGTDRQIIDRFRMSSAMVGNDDSPKKGSAKSPKNKVRFDVGDVKVELTSKQPIPREKQIVALESILRTLRKG